MSSTNDILVFVPTYNEFHNVEKLLNKLLALNIAADILIVDDNSPDGTAERAREVAQGRDNVKVFTREGKLGIGSAHRFGIRYAYDQGYKTLITMDADGTHDPNDIPRLLAKSADVDLVIPSRYLIENSLPGWNLYRRMMTRGGHLLTRYLLGIKYDATGAFRLYRLDTVDREFLDQVKVDGYSFFFESLYVLTRKREYRVAEIGVALPARTYGSSKMSTKEVIRSVARLLKTAIGVRLRYA